MIWIEPQHALERPLGIGLAREIDQDLAETYQCREVINIASDQRHDSWQCASRPARPSVRSHQFHHRGIVIRSGDEHGLELFDRARIVATLGAVKRNSGLRLSLVDREARAVRRNRLALLTEAPRKDRQLASARWRSAAFALP
jgi:hypothetical protein